MDVEAGTALPYSGLATVEPGPEVEASLLRLERSAASVLLRTRHTADGRVEVVVDLAATTVLGAVREALAVLADVGLPSPVTLEVMPTVELGRRSRSAAVDDLVSVSEAARITGVSRQAVLGRIRSGSLAARKVGSTYTIARAALGE